MVQMVWACLLCISGSYGQLLDYIIFAVLVFYILTIVGLVRTASHAAGRSAALPRHRLSGAAGDLYCDGFICRCRTIALQTAVHVAGADCGAAGHPGILRMVAKRGGKMSTTVAPQGETKRMSNLFATKPLNLLMEEARETGEHSLKRTLWEFFSLRHWAWARLSKGAGIFVDGGAGRAVRRSRTLHCRSFYLDLGCAFAGLCYAEFAAMIPLAGSAYTYAYATLGELLAWIIGWDLTLEYAMGASTVSSGWFESLHRTAAEYFSHQDAAVASLRPLDRA